MIRSDLSEGAENGTSLDAGVCGDSLRALQRHIAEARLRLDGGDTAETLSQEETKRVIHELRVHQIELEMQNEALRESQMALDAVRARYFDLYDMAPIAYCTVSAQGLIWQVNLAAADLLGHTRNALLNQPFSRCIFIEDQDIYYMGRRRLASSGEPRCLELRLVKRDGEPFLAELTIAAGQDAAGKPEARIVLSDISERSKADAEQARIRLALQEKNDELQSTRNAANNFSGELSDQLLSMRRDLGIQLQESLGRTHAADGIALTQKQMDEIDGIESAARRLLSLVDQHLDPAAAAAIASRN